MAVDSHCHLDDAVFDGDRDAVIAAAGAQGVSHLVTISTALEKIPGVLALAARYPQISASVGVHPHEADKTGDNLYAVLRPFLEHPKAVGIGETGLDYHYEFSRRDRQQRAFEAHIRLAQETGLPLIVHTRAADEDTVSMLASALKEKEFPVLIHCFSAGYETGIRFLDMGAYLSVSGIVTFKKAEELQKTVRDAPLDRLLVETDAPYLAPVPYRGKRNEPAFIVKTLEAVAVLKNMAYDEAERVTTENFYRLFTKARAGGTEPAVT